MELAEGPRYDVQRGREQPEGRTKMERQLIHVASMREAGPGRHLIRGKF